MSANMLTLVLWVPATFVLLAGWLRLCTMFAGTRLEGALAPMLFFVGLAAAWGVRSLAIKITNTWHNYRCACAMRSTENPIRAVAADSVSINAGAQADDAENVSRHYVKLKKKALAAAELVGA